MLLFWLLLFFIDSKHCTNMQILKFTSTTTTTTTQPVAPNITAAYKIMSLASDCSLISFVNVLSNLIFRQPFLSVAWKTLSKKKTQKHIMMFGCHSLCELARSSFQRYQAKTKSILVFSRKIVAMFLLHLSCLMPSLALCMRSVVWRRNYLLTMESHRVPFELNHSKWILCAFVYSNGAGRQSFWSYQNVLKTNSHSKMYRTDRMTSALTEIMYKSLENWFCRAYGIMAGSYEWENYRRITNREGIEWVGLRSGINRKRKR